ncbi:MAG TPA: carbohydrate porin [Stellaceae bacterium]|nr:carbohydrate porin [Stellaceae bacterium]
MVRAGVLAIAMVAAWAAMAAAQEPPPTPGAAEPTESAEPSPNPHAGGLADRDVLTGDWGGLRSTLEDHGLRLGAIETSEVLGNPTGGVRRGAIYEGRLEMDFDLDLEKSVGWTGATLHANAYQIHGRGLSANDLGNNILTASNIEAARTTRLFDLWLQQQLLDDMVSVRVGQLAADDEFFTSLYGANFVNSTFGWPAILASNLPSGGPAYPLAAPGLRIKVSPTDQWSFQTAVFDGDPAGPGSGNPQLRDASGTAFRLDDHPFVISELAYAINQQKDAAGLPGTYKLGAWYHDGSFADQRFDSSGLSLANPASSGVAATHRGDYGFYALLDQMVWREPEAADQGLGIFLRLAGNPADRNLVDFYGDGGVTYKGLLPDRPDDVIGLGVAYANISDAARSLDKDSAAFGMSRPVRDFEAAIELTYSAQIMPWWTLQPDLQYIFHPTGGGAPASAPQGPAIGDALVLGLRTTVKF